VYQTNMYLQYYLFDTFAIKKKKRETKDIVSLSL